MSDCCHKKKKDYLLLGSTSIIAIAYLGHLFFADYFQQIAELHTFTQSSFELMNRMSWGLALGIVFVGLLEKIPREFIHKLMGKEGTLGGIVRATAGGVLLDLCSHGILLVGMKLYQRGLSLGQTMAFLIASPWNSFSLTLVLWALIGFKAMLAFLLLSMFIAVISGLIFDQLVKKRILPANPNPPPEISNDYSLKKETQKALKNTDFSISWLWKTFIKGLKGSKSILKWILFGTVMASLLRAFVSPEQFQTLFGPSMAGLGLTLLVATILEVCSEGSAPIAADIFNRAGSSGNSFAFLMTGVSTDYTEILSLKEATKSWKIAFFLPLVTLPQIIVVAIIMNSR